jgi:hypothetical protein
MDETNVTSDAASDAANLIQHERIDEVWKKAIEMDLKLSVLQERTQELSENLRQLTTKVEEIAETLDEIEVIEEEENSSEGESNETVKVEIVTTPETPQQTQEQQTPKDNLMKRILFG